MMAGDCMEALLGGVWKGLGCCVLVLVGVWVRVGVG